MNILIAIVVSMAGIVVGIVDENFICQFFQKISAPIIPKTFPDSQNIDDARPMNRFESGELKQKFMILRNDSRDLSLLEHQL